MAWWKDLQRTCYERHLEEMSRYPGGGGIELPCMPPMPMKGEPAWKSGEPFNGRLDEAEPKGGACTGEPTGEAKGSGLIKDQWRTLESSWEGRVAINLSP